MPRPHWSGHRWSYCVCRRGIQQSDPSIVELSFYCVCTFYCVCRRGTSPLTYGEGLFCLSTAYANGKRHCLSTAYADVKRSLATAAASSYGFLSTAYADVKLHYWQNRIPPGNLSTAYADVKPRRKTTARWASSPFYCVCRRETLQWSSTPADLVPFYCVCRRETGC